MTARQETINLLARQIALIEGRVYQRLDDKHRRRLETLAANMVATVERKMTAQSKGLELALRANWELPA